jgi:hypothetical protein
VGVKSTNYIALGALITIGLFGGLIVGLAYAPVPKGDDGFITSIYHSSFLYEHTHFYFFNDDFSCWGNLQNFRIGQHIIIHQASAMSLCEITIVKP